MASGLVCQVEVGGKRRCRRRMTIMSGIECYSWPIVVVAAVLCFDVYSIHSFTEDDEWHSV